MRGIKKYEAIYASKYVCIELIAIFKDGNKRNEINIANKKIEAF